MGTRGGGLGSYKNWQGLATCDLRSSSQSDDRVIWQDHVQPFALPPSFFLFFLSQSSKWKGKGKQKNPLFCFKRVGNVDPGGVVYFSIWCSLKRCQRIFKWEKLEFKPFFYVSCLVVCRDSSKRAVFKSFKPEYLCSVVLLVKIYIEEKKKRLLKTPGSKKFWKTSVGV